MIRCCSLFLLVLCHIASAQVINGVIVDAENKNAIDGVTVVNKHTGNADISNSKGQFSIYYTPGDTLRFIIISHAATEIVTGTAPYDLPITITMQPTDVLLQQVLISGRTKYQKDSAERRAVFSHELERPLVPKPKFVGIGCAGCFGWIADKITGNSKKPKKFRKGYFEDDERLFVESRYNAGLVALLTPMNDSDSIAMFIYKYPMEYKYARLASDLEIKAWVRNNYKEYIAKKEDEDNAR